MTFLKDDIIRFRLEKAQVTFNEAKSLAKDGYWNDAANRLYYSCFYSVIALLAVSEVLTFVYNLSLNQSSFRFRGQADYSWTLQPSIYRYNSFHRYQTVEYENNVLSAKSNIPQPPLTHTNFDLEW